MESEENITDEGQSKPVPVKKKKEIFSFYGDQFDGKFSKVGEMANLIPVFKDYYFENKRKDIEVSAVRLLRAFNEQIAPQRFFPYPAQFAKWRKKWDAALLLELGLADQALMEKRRIRDVVNVRDEERGITLVPGDDELERSTNTLAGMLANDAVEMLQNDRDNEDIYTSDEIIKRKKYALEVMTHITKKVQGKEALKLKKAAEGREQAGFLMDLLNRAAAGQVSDNDLDVLRSSVIDTSATVVAEPQAQ